MEVKGEVPEMKVAWEVCEEAKGRAVAEPVPKYLYFVIGLSTISSSPSFLPRTHLRWSQCRTSPRSSLPPRLSIHPPTPPSFVALPKSKPNPNPEDEQPWLALQTARKDKSKSFDTGIFAATDCKARDPSLVRAPFGHPPLPRPSVSLPTLLPGSVSASASASASGLSSTSFDELSDFALYRIFVEFV